LKDAGALLAQFLFQNFGQGVKELTHLLAAFIRRGRDPLVRLGLGQGLGAGVLSGHVFLGPLRYGQLEKMHNKVAD
jgi:hypothetical protein